jgi:formylglycine-generating enzyme required for sulfatase activity
MSESLSYKNETNERPHLRTLHKTNPVAGLLTVLAALAMTGATAFGAIPVTIETVTVGHADNAADTRYSSPGYGSVSYEYQIGKYEVTNAQYVAFLNAVVGTGADTYNLYDSEMSSNSKGGITRNDDNVFVVKAGYDLKPVNYVSFYDAARFVNWLTNGQGGAGTTEYGLYAFDGVNNLVSKPDHAAAAAGSGGWVLPSENEWYKAAYYNPTLNNGKGGYTTYPWTGGANPVNDKGVVNGANFGENGTVTDAGSYIYASSYFGTYDQAGNLWEWNDTIHSGSRLVLRGGSFNGPETNLGAEYGRNYDSPANEYEFFGFRVASLTAVPVPEPGTWAGAAGLTMLVIGMWVRRFSRARRG